MSNFQPTHNLIIPGSAYTLVECVPQDGTETWYILYTDRDSGGDYLYTLGADGKVRNNYTCAIIEGATVERLRPEHLFPGSQSLDFPGGSVPMPTAAPEWEAQVYEWRKWALRELGRTLWDFQQASDDELRKALRGFRISGI